MPFPMRYWDLSDCKQVIVPYLVILWVSTQRSLTSESISGATGSIHSLRSQGSTDGDGSLPGKDINDVMEVNGEAPASSSFMTRMLLKRFRCYTV